MTVAAPAQIDLPLSAAVEELTGFEIIAIETHFKSDFDSLGGVKTLLGTIWVYANRGDQKMSWVDVKSLTVKQMQNTFLPEPEDTDPEDPDSDTGKDS